MTKFNLKLRSVETSVEAEDLHSAVTQALEQFLHNVKIEVTNENVEFDIYNTVVCDYKYFGFNTFSPNLKNYYNNVLVPSLPGSVKLPQMQTHNIHVLFADVRLGKIQDK